MERRFCDIRQRYALCSKDQATAQHVGGLVSAVIKLVRELVDGDIVDKKDIAKAIKKEPSNFSTFLGGGQASDAWISKGREALAYLLTGYTEVKNSESRVAKRIDSHFFRGANHEPSFFERERTASPHAWSIRELATQITYFRRVLNDPRRGQVWYFTGGVRFFGDGDDKVIASLRDCIKRGNHAHVRLPQRRTRG